MNSLALQTYYIFQLYESGKLHSSQWEYISQIISLLIYGKKTVGVFVFLHTFKDTVNF